MALKRADLSLTKQEKESHHVNGATAKNPNV